MAINITRDGVDTISLVVPSGVVSGNPVAVGKIVGVALEDRGAFIATQATIRRRGTADLSVKGVDGSGNSAVAIGDQLYYNSAATPKINKDAGGVPFGFALATITSGSTATIGVLLGAA